MSARARQMPRDAPRVGDVDTATQLRLNRWICMFVESKLLIAAWLRSPLRIGTVLPSGPTLAAAVAAEVPVDSNDPVVELGAGTGPLTEAMLQAGVPPSKLVAIERDPLLFRFLVARHPGLMAIEGDAVNLPQLLRPLGVIRARAVVSSLPIVWFPEPIQRSLVEHACALLEGGGPFIQVTNGLGSPLPDESLGLEGRCAARIWSNVLPASVWVYRRTHTPGRTPARSTADRGAPR